MISGIGCDIVDLNRLNLDNECFVLKLLTKNEFLIFKNKNSLKQKKEFLGGRFAAKEAFFKAHGIEHGMLSFHDIEILMASQKLIILILLFQSLMKMIMQLHMLL